MVSVDEKRIERFVKTYSEIREDIDLSAKRTRNGLVIIDKVLEFSNITDVVFNPRDKVTSVFIVRDKNDDWLLGYDNDKAKLVSSIKKDLKKWPYFKSFNSTQHKIVLSSKLSAWILGKLLMSQRELLFHVYQCGGTDYGFPKSAYYAANKVDLDFEKLLSEERKENPLTAMCMCSACIRNNKIIPTMQLYELYQELNFLRTMKDSITKYRNSEEIKQWELKTDSDGQDIWGKNGEEFIKICQKLENVKLDII